MTKVIIILLIWLRRRRLAKQPISPTEPKKVSTAIDVDGAPTIITPGKSEEPPDIPTTIPPTVSVPAPEPTEPDIIQCTLTVKINGEGTTNPPQGSHQFKEGTIININASPSAGWQFVGWVGSVDEPYTESTTLTMNADKTVAATFQKL